MSAAYACHACGNPEQIHVAVNTEMHLVQEPHAHLVYDTPDGGEYMHPTNPARCGACGVSGTVADFVLQRVASCAAPYACPKCNGTNLQVTVSTMANLIQRDSGHLETEPTYAYEWDDNNAMRCTDCEHLGIARDFETKRTFRAACWISEGDSVMLTTISNAGMDDADLLTLGRSQAFDIANDLPPGRVEIREVPR